MRFTIPTLTAAVLATGLASGIAEAASGRLGVKLRDSVPIVGLFETRRDLPRWIERLMTVQDLAATAAFSYDDRDFSLLDFETVFRKATIRAKALDMCKSIERCGGEVEISSVAGRHRMQTRLPNRPRVTLGRSDEA